MKKFRIVGLLLVLCLITSSFVGVTFAKYISTATGSDTAVVAKWEIEVNDGGIVDITEANTITFNLFNTIGDTNTPTTDDTDVDNAADNNATTKQIIAPGTSGYFKFTVENKSEVNAKYTLAYSETETLPIQYSLTGEDEDWEDSLAALNVTDKAINMDAKDTIEIYWRWVFDNEATPVGHAGQTNANDTALGVTAQSTPPEITVGITITAYQVD